MNRTTGQLDKIPDYQYCRLNFTIHKYVTEVYIAYLMKQKAFAVIIWIILLAIVFFRPWIRRLPGLPEITSETKPWTYWWWMGSAVDTAEITHQLKSFAEKGLGGVHIIPIYGVKGYEEVFIPYLSTEWMKMLKHTLNEACKLELGVDMTTGTGWPFGGPQVNSTFSAKEFSPAFPETGYAIPTGQMVKRAAPGAEGLVIDYFNKDALAHYLKKFDSAFRYPDMDLSCIRAMYNDSYEVYGANWTVDFLSEFKRRRGYDLEPYLNILSDTTKNQNSVRIWSDYHETVADLILEEFTVEWHDWAEQSDFLTRNQAHGSPGNLLDLYGICDIPETESFGPGSFNIPGLRQDDKFEKERLWIPEPLAMKFASSAANTQGKKLVSAETATWLADHFKVSLSQVKPHVDQLFIAGINHIFYHGITYSPENENFPGWLFYASTNFGLQSHVWPDLPELNSYITRCQLLLQNSSPDQDFLVYFPIYDLWTGPGPDDKVFQLDVHSVDKWLLNSPFGILAGEMIDAGYMFDYISDKQLFAVHIDGHGHIISGNSSYEGIILPCIDHIPLETLSAIADLAEQDVKVLFHEQFPVTVPGYFDWEQKQKTMEKMMDSLKLAPSVKLFRQIKDIKNLTGLSGEQMKGKGLSFIRKKDRYGTFYFISNFGPEVFNDTITLSVSFKTVELYDPLSGKRGLLPVIKGKEGERSVTITLSSGESVFIRCYDKKRMGPLWRDYHTTGHEIVLPENWKLEFHDGYPGIKGYYLLDSLGPWTDIKTDTLINYYSGYGKYSLDFVLADTIDLNQRYVLDMGDVRETANVWLNGQYLGKAWCIPFRLSIPPGILAPENHLSIDLRNLSANRIIMLDRTGMNWKKFYDINFVHIDYTPFDASDWEPVESGLLGPVKIYLAK